MRWMAICTGFYNVLYVPGGERRISEPEREYGFGGIPHPLSQ